jgi:hypothetical protein
VVARSALRDQRGARFVGAACDQAQRLLTVVSVRGA